jgi:hypothetical protein
MKRVWIAAILIVVVIFSCIASQHYLYRITIQLSDEIYQADQLAQVDNLSGSAKLVYNSYREWKTHENAIGAIIRHQEMDDIESLYLRALQNANNQDKNEYLVQSKELQGLLLHLADMEKPKMKNLF